MAKTNIALWDTVAANNADLNSITSQENVMTPGKVNDYLRELVSQGAKFYDDLGGVNTVAGTGDVITVTTSSVFTALATGLVLSFKASATNTTNVTINVDGLGAKAIRKFTTAEAALVAGDLVSGRKYLLIYDATANGAAGAWILINQSAANGVLGTPISGVATNLTGLPLTTGVTGTLPVANGGTNYTGGPWTSYTATMTPGAGSITTQSSNSTYLQIGKIVIVNVGITITTVGTGSGSMTFNIPVAPRATVFIAGREYGTTGLMLSGQIYAGLTSAQILTYANANPTVSNGSGYSFFGIYEAQ